MQGIAHEEMARLGCPGYTDGLGAGLTIGLPPVLNFGPEWMREKVGRQVLSGEKRVALAISEAFAGSDVAGMMTRCGICCYLNGWILLCIACMILRISFCISSECSMIRGARRRS